MIDIFSIKFDSGKTSFEVSGPDQQWVDNKVEELKTLLELNSSNDSEADEIKKSSPKRSNLIAKRAANKSVAKKTALLEGELTGKWTDELPDQIEAWISERKEGFKGTAKQAAILAVFLKDVVGIDKIVVGDFELIYRKLGWDTISHTSQLGNAAARDKYFTREEGIYELTHTGTKYGRDLSKDKLTNK